MNPPLKKDGFFIAGIPNIRTVKKYAGHAAEAAWAKEICHGFPFCRQGRPIYSS
jgi:hypothetical protein